MKIRYALLILAVIVCHVLVNYQTLNTAQPIRICDESQRILTGRLYYKELFNFSTVNNIKKFGCILSLDKGQGHPHLFEFTEAVSWEILEAMKIRDNNVNLMILMTNSLFLIILIISTYGIGSIIYNKNIGLLAALLTSIFPLVFGQSRNAMLDFPLTAMISLSIFLLLKTNGFRSILYSILAGVSFGLSQLTKESAIIFIFAPLIYYFLESYISNKKNNTLVNFIITVLIFIVIFSSVYLNPNNHHAFKTYFEKICYAATSLDPLYYFKVFIEITGPYILFLSLPLLLSYILNLKRREKLLLFWFIVPIILFSFSPNKASRFILPVFPAFSLILVQEIFSINISNKAKRIICFIFIFISILQYALFNSGFLDKGTTEMNLNRGILSGKKDTYLHDASVLLDIFKKETLGMANPERVKILFLFFVPQLHHFIMTHGFEVKVPLQPDFVDFNKNPFDCAVVAQSVLDADYIVIEGIPEYSVAAWHQKTVSCLRDNFVKNKDRFKMVSSIKTFDGHDIYVYKKIIN